MFMYLTSPFASAKFERNSLARTVEKSKTKMKERINAAEIERGGRERRVPLSALNWRSFMVQFH